jgi:hydroxypyruvate isomerase
MDRRTFLAAGFAAGTAILSNSRAEEKPAPASPAGKFKLKYAPGFGMFEESAGKDPIDQLKFMADEGFSAMFDNDLPRKPPELQESIAKQCELLGLTIGPFVAYSEFSKPTLVLKDDAIRDVAANRMKAMIEVSKRTGCKMGVVAPGIYAINREWDYQTANMIDNLKFLAGICEPAGFVMLIEPLNNFKDHPGMFLSRIPQCYQIAGAVNSPSCKIVDDLYHQQISEGNLIPNIDRAWDQIAAFHLGDNPGRKEPTTGEINFKNIFKHLHEKEYKGVLCMEHGKSKPGKPGERAVIDAYRWCDDF